MALYFYVYSEHKTVVGAESSPHFLHLNHPASRESFNKHSTTFNFIDDAFTQIKKLNPEGAQGALYLKFI